MAGRWCRKLAQDVFRPMDIEQDGSVSAFVGDVPVDVEIRSEVGVALLEP